MIPIRNVLQYLERAASLSPERTACVDETYSLSYQELCHISRAVGAAAGLLGIRVVGRASDKGELEPLHKCRGEARALDAIVQEMADRGFRGGRVHIDHAENEAAAQQLCHKLRLKFPGCKPTVGRCGAMCSYSAESGGLLVGCET